ncbi:MAG: thermonuclease family protein [Alphaproteobacteria bacterium]|nr:thermonuclease family protein [Alphaproteobacteria bacterium]
MPFLKKTIIWTIFLAAMYFGGVGAQSSNNFFQGMGFFSIVAACACLYIIFKLIWGPLGNLSRLLLVAGVLVYIAFSIGLFNGNTLKSFLSGVPRPQAPVSYEKEDQTAEINALEIQMFGNNQPAAETTSAEAMPSEAQTASVEQNNPNTQPQIPVQANQNRSANGFLDTVKSWFSGDTQSNSVSSSKTLNPMNYPEMVGHPQVASGSILILDGVRIKLFGIDAPDPTQTCENRYGNSYICGKEAIIWMRNWLNHKDVSCRIISRIENNRTTGICFSDDGKYDVAAAVVSAGWAVAYTEHTQIYVEYERQAAEEHRGLWNGRFYKPWDWRRLQNRKIDIKENKSKFNFKGWFK